MQRLALFARPPLADSVKTRLAPALTPPLALALYRAMLADALEAGARVADQRSVWWASPPDSTPDASLEVELQRGGWQPRLQAGDNLGARLAHAITELCGAHDTLVVYGADCPELGADGLAAAFQELEHADVVIGPSGDGGYYLIGLQRPAPELFGDIAWSTDLVLGQTLERAERARLSVTLLGKLDDIDRPEDVVRCATRELAATVRARPAAQARAGDTRTAHAGVTSVSLASALRLGTHTRGALRAFGLLP